MNKCVPKILRVVYTSLNHDIQIFNLETQLQAFAARTSNIQSRLLSTLDTLDILRHSHTIELTSETKAKEKLSDRLDHYIDYVKAVESERDDLRDAVALLIEKGGSRWQVGEARVRIHTHRPFIRLFIS